MDPTVEERVARAREVLWARIRAHLAAGGRLKDGVWGVDRVPVPGKPGQTTWVPRVAATCAEGVVGEPVGCCPMGVVLLGEVATSTQPWAGINTLRDVLGISDAEGQSFMQGYDARDRPALAQDPWFQLGRAARQEFGP